MMRYSFGDYMLDAERYELRRAGRLVPIEPRVLDVLAYLVQHAGRTLTTEELLAQLYPNEFAPHNRLTNAVAQARKALHDTGQEQRYIQTVRRRGYRFVAPVVARSPRAADLLAAQTPDTPRPQAAFALDQAEAASPLTLGTSTSLSATPPVPPAVPQSEATTSAAASAAAPAMPADEWRPLTVLVCQLVGVSEPTAPLDREARLEVMRTYYAMASEVMQRFDGHLAQSQGERLLGYFGYPRAHEDDARRAVLTGLGMVEGMAALNRRYPHDRSGRLTVQVGIHTGVELVGTVGGGNQQTSLVVGETPTMAAGLQRLAAPDTVVISPATWHLVDGYVLCEVLGTHLLEDFSEPLTVYRVLQESPAHHRLEVAIRRGLTPFVGREHEVGLLHECWAQATEGRGQVVVLRGEAGIGKSRLMQEFTSHLTGKSYTRLDYHCSPYYQHTALYPVVTSFQRLLQFKPEETADARLRKLEELLEQSGMALAEGVALWAALLSLPLPARYPPLTLTPESQRQKTLEVLLAWLHTAAEEQPVCVLVEDLHWADASTLEWLTLLIDQVPTTRLLLLLACRPEFPLPWAARSHLSQVTLRRLSRPHVETMVQRLTDDKALPAEVLHHLVATTDGVPLFVEELTKMVLESGLVTEREGQYELARPLSALAIPATLHDSLVARLDQLGPAKQVAQLCATVGQKFSYAVIQAVAPVEEARLQQGLRQLVDAELLYPRGLPPQAQYTFKHVLIQEAAYQSLPRSTRRHYHRQIAQVLETRFPDAREAHPELLAHHYTEAGLGPQAVPYWQRAGQHAFEHSAMIEAVGHLTKGLKWLRSLPETPERQRQELTLQLTLGASLLTVKSQAAPEVERAYTRAQELCQQVGDHRQLFSVLAGLRRLHGNRGNLRTAHELAERCFVLAQDLQDRALLEEAHGILGSTLFRMGELVAARMHLEQGAVLDDAQPCRLRTFSHGANPRVNCLCHAALTLWTLGYPDQALTRAREALTVAQESSHVYSLGYALRHVARLHQLRREAPLARERAEAALALTHEHGLVYQTGSGMWLQGWALAEQGSAEAGIGLLRQELATWQALGTKQEVPQVLAELAQVYGKVGHTEDGLRLLAEALPLIRKHEERHYEAEVYRLTGELLLQQAAGRAAPRTDIVEASAGMEAEWGTTMSAWPIHIEAKRCFLQALDIARRQQAKSWELRAAMSLSRLWQLQGKREAAQQVLRETYDWFTEGFDTADLQEAKALLDEWS